MAILGIGSLIGGGLSAAGSIVGNILSAKANREAKKKIEQEQQENEAWYKRRYNEDATQRADAQRMITMVNDAVKQRNKAAEGTAAVMGSGSEAVAQAKAANNALLSDTAAQIAAQGEARKDLIEQQYLTNKRNATDKLADLDLQRSANIAKMTTELLNTAGDIAGDIDYSGKGLKIQTTAEDANKVVD